MIKSPTNLVIIEGKLVNKPIKQGEKTMFKIVSDDPKNNCINLVFDIETKDRRIGNFVNDLLPRQDIKCTCILGNKIVGNHVVPSLECYDIRLV